MAGQNGLKRSAKIVAGTIDRYEMIPAGQKVLVAFSGGPDSTALTLLLLELGYPLHLCHVDHLMRSDSAADAVHCEKAAKQLGIEISIGQAALSAPTEAAARQARYEILQEEATKNSAGVIATGHTRDDHAETVAMRLERGGFGLGIPPKRGNIVRPIIQLSKSECVSLCEESGIRFVVDPSNSDTRYTRNRVRQRLKDQPPLTDALLKIGEDASRRFQQSSQALEAALGNTISIEGAEAAIDRTWLSGLPAGDARLFVSQVVRRMGFEPHRASVRGVLGIVSSTGKRVDLGDGLAAWTEAHRLRIGKPQAPIAWPETELRVPGDSRWGEWTLSFEILSDRPVLGGASAEVMDADATGQNLWVRQWRPGDRFRPLGSGEKKLQDFFTDQKLPRSERSKVPVVHNGGRIVWVAGSRIDDGSKVTSSTTRFLVARWQRKPKPDVAPQGSTDLA